MAEAAPSSAPTPATHNTSQPENAPSAAPVAAPGTTQAAKAEAVRMMKLKVDGQDLELPESEIIALAQQGKAANKRFQEASVTRREAEQIIQFGKDNPGEFLKRTGQNVRQWAEDFLLKEIQREQMTPEQREAMAAKEELNQYKAREKQLADQAKAQKEQAETEQQMKAYDDMFVKALADSKLPKTPYTVKRMAELTLVNLKKGLNLDASQLAKIVREDYVSEQKELMGGLDGDALLEFLGKDAVKKLSKAQLAKYKGAKTNNATPQAKPKDTSKTPDPVASWKEFRKKNRGLS